MRQQIVWTAKIILYATFLVPLVVVPSSFIFPFIVPKILLLRTLIILLLGCYVLLLVGDWETYQPRFSPISVALLIFLVSFILSTFFGVDPYHSFWDNHERMLGLFTIAHYVIYYFVCTALLKTWTDWKWALRIFLLAGSIVMFIGVMQVANPNLLLNQGSDRVASSLGNPIYVGGYGLFLWFSALLLWTREKETVWRWVYGGLMLLAFAGIFYSGTRGSMLGLLAGVGVTICGYAFFLKGQRKLRVGLAAATLLFVALLLSAFVFRHSAFVQSIPALNRFTSISLKSGTTDTRFIAWRIAIDSWKERPIVGWGPNNFFYAFNQHYNPRSLEYGYGETWFDNAHNVLLNTLSVQGIVGLASYLGLFGVAIVVLVRHRSLRANNVHAVVIGSAFLLAHLLQNVTVFENLTSYLYFMFWLALLNRLASLGETEAATGAMRTATGHTSAPPRAQNEPWHAIGLPLVGGVGAVCLFLIFIFNVQPARANQKTLAALQDFSSDPAVGLTSMRETLAFSSPHIDDIRADLSRSVVTFVNGRYQTLDKAISQQFLDLANEALQKNIALHPLDIRNYITLAQASQLAAVVNNQQQPLLDAERYLAEALKYSPRRQQVIYSLSAIKLQNGKSDEAVAMLEGSIKDDNKIAEGYWRLAYMYQYMGQLQKAKAILAQAHVHNIIFDGVGKQVEDSIMSAK